MDPELREEIRYRAQRSAEAETGAQSLFVWLALAAVAGWFAGSQVGGTTLGIVGVIAGVAIVLLLGLRDRTTRQYFFWYAVIGAVGIGIVGSLVGWQNVANVLR
jgi:hypothetical protein